MNSLGDADARSSIAFATPTHFDNGSSNSEDEFQDAIDVSMDDE